MGTLVPHFINHAPSFSNSRKWDMTLTSTQKTMRLGESDGAVRPMEYEIGVKKKAVPLC